MYAIGMDDDPPPLVSAADWVQTPPAVQLAFLTLVDLVHDLSAQVQELRARLNQTSRNSSKPPSSDPPSAPPAPPARVPRARTRGAQKGHPDQQRPLLPPEQVDTIVPLRPTTARTVARAWPAICHSVTRSGIARSGSCRPSDQL